MGGADRLRFRRGRRRRRVAQMPVSRHFTEPLRKSKRADVTSAIRGSSGWRGRSFARSPGLCSVLFCFSPLHFHLSLRGLPSDTTRAARLGVEAGMGSGFTLTQNDAEDKTRIRSICHTDSATPTTPPLSTSKAKSSEEVARSSFEMVSKINKAERGDKRGMREKEREG